ncbi:MAG: MerR family DNA-binding transcriptional regulator [Acidimicrobiia bacterium]|nr:MerR family DNA-binding transcriptional regulator [Acidimicrobiia bacterium]
MVDSAALTIGEVINLLKGDFPDVTVSKVRFLESQGLIDPPRSTSGYRQFTTADVKRLRYILEQQRDHYLPLKIIKSQLTLWERGDETTFVAPVGPDAHELLEEPGDTVDADELLRRSGLPRRHLRALIEDGLLHPIEEPGGPRFSSRDVAVARESTRLLSYGFESRHLRSVRIGAERRVELLDQLTAALRRNHSPEARRQVAETLAACADALGKLSSLVVAAGIRQMLDND